MRVLFITEGSVTKPILRSQGLPLLQAMAQKGHQIFLLSFETKPRSSEFEHILNTYGNSIRFLRVRVLSEKIARAQFQALLLGPLLTLFFVLRFRIHLIHARSYVPAIMALPSKILLGTRLLFDMRGLFIDEMISRGSWSPNSPVVRIMRFFEKQLILKSDSVVVVSEAFKKHLLSLDYVKESDKEKIKVISNCVDLQKFAKGDRKEMRKHLGLADKIVLVYAGSLDPHQQPEEMVRFFSAFSKVSSRAFFLFLTYDDVERAERLFEKSAVDSSRYRVLSVHPDDVPQYLSAGNCAILLRKQELLNQVACPLKFAEYLAAGLMPLITRRVGDTEFILKEHPIGIVIDGLADENLTQAGKRLITFLKKEKSFVRKRCFYVAKQFFSFEDALREYSEAYWTLNR